MSPSSSLPYLPPPLPCAFDDNAVLATIPGVWCSGTRRVRGAATALQLSQDGATSARRQIHLAQVRYCETETRSSTSRRQPPSGAPWDQ